MPENLKNIVHYLDEILKPEKKEGLVVKKQKNIEKVALALNLNKKIIKQAQEKCADLLIIFNPRVRSKYLKNLKISAYVSETPITESNELKIEQTLADKLGIRVKGSFEGGYYGTSNLETIEDFKARMHKSLGIKPKVKKKKKKIGKVAVLHNFDAEWLKKAKEMGCDTVLGGRNPHIFPKAKGVNLISGEPKIIDACSIIKLGETLEKKFKIKFFFIT